MIDWLFGNGQNIVAVAEIVGFVIIGVLSFWGMFSSKDSDRRSESDKVADGLIDRLQKTVDQNAKDTQIMSARIDEQQKEIHQLQGKNEAYLQIITLRDPSTAKVFDEAPEIFQIARDTKALAEKQLNAITGLTNAMKEFINKLPPLTPIMTA